MLSGRSHRRAVGFLVSSALASGNPVGFSGYLLIGRYVVYKVNGRWAVAQASFSNDSGVVQPGQSIPSGFSIPGRSSYLYLCHKSDAAESVMISSLSSQAGVNQTLNRYSSLTASNTKDVNESWMNFYNNANGSIVVSLSGTRHPLNTDIFDLSKAPMNLSDEYTSSNQVHLDEVSFASGAPIVSSTQSTGGYGQRTYSDMLSTPDRIIIFLASRTGAPLSIWSWGVAPYTGSLADGQYTSTYSGSGYGTTVPPEPYTRPGSNQIASIIICTIINRRAYNPSNTDYFGSYASAAFNDQGSISYTYNSWAGSLTYKGPVSSYVAFSSLSGLSFTQDGSIYLNGNKSIVKVNIAGQPDGFLRTLTDVPDYADRYTPPGAGTYIDDGSTSPGPPPL